MSEISRQFSENEKNHADLQRFANICGYSYCLKFPKPNNLFIIQFIFSTPSLGRSAAGGTLTPVSWQHMRCSVSGRRERRKVAKPYWGSRRRAAARRFLGRRAMGIVRRSLRTTTLHEGSFFQVRNPSSNFYARRVFCDKEFSSCFRGWIVECCSWTKNMTEKIQFYFHFQYFTVARMGLNW